MKTINYGAVQERSLGTEWSRRAGWGRREFSWTLRVGGVRGGGDKGNVGTDDKGNVRSGNTE